MTSVALWLFLVYLTLGMRVNIGRTGDFAGLPVLEVLFVAAAVLAWVGAGRPWPAVRSGWVETVGPLFFLLLVYPAAGVLLGTYGVTSLYSWMVVLVPLAVLALTVTAGARILPFCHAAIVIHGAYALGQALYRLGLLPTSVWGPLQQWDIESQRSLSEAYVIVGRSTGLFINANTFAMWGVAALVLSYCYLSGARRHSAAALAIVGILASQSRTGIFCLAVLLLVWAVHAVRDWARLGRIVVGAAVFVLPGTLLLYAWGLPQRLLEGGLANRLGSVTDILTEGIRTDANLMGRVEAWRLALDYSPADPRFSFGTLGPPQVQFGGFIDNQFVAFYLQGGLFLVGAYVLALLSPLVLHLRGGPRVMPLAFVCAVVALGSLTLAPMFTVQATCLVWVVAGLTLLGDTAPSDGTDFVRSRTGHGRSLLALRP
ncbi:O-antigen ligase family protein [Ornithinimicrobium cryptoxanthini]|uniref:O-antigen ligase n=1 Tax=Ornithinimicrobium cryptoxanthini TaxID=2934161 RepID=A0ABY4YID9_9MICO|nr:hypothetical protein [Ornithinimicrobium cryptoxanthini]USQ76113.1 hypothetical protein NF557_16225 [Ornithinimicrobium cryptoxanthini]